MRKTGDCKSPKSDPFRPRMTVAVSAPATARPVSPTATSSPGSRAFASGEYTQIYDYGYMAARVGSKR